MLWKEHHTRSERDCQIKLAETTTCNETGESVHEQYQKRPVSQRKWEWPLEEEFVLGEDFAFHVPLLRKQRESNISKPP